MRRCCCDAEPAAACTLAGKPLAVLRCRKRRSRDAKVCRPPKENAMSKGMDSKKSDKKKPLKTMKEKKQAKAEKKASRK